MSEVVDADAVVTSLTTPVLREVIVGSGHLGVTLSNHALGVRVDHAHTADAVFCAGLREGDVITSVNGVTVCHHEAACDALGSNEEKPAVLGGPTGHAVTYYSAAAAERWCAEARAAGSGGGGGNGASGGMFALGRPQGSVAVKAVLVILVLLLPPQMKVLAALAVVFMLITAR